MSRAAGSAPALPALPALPAPGEPPVPPLPGATRRVGAYTLFVRECGRAEAEPAVFVHGLGGASTNWTDLMFLLGDRVHGYAPDLPGFGRSDPPPLGRYELDTHARAVLALMLEIGQPVHLLGNSLGGAVAARLAALHPDLVRTLTLISPALPSFRPRRGTDPVLPLILVPGISTMLMRRLAHIPPDRRVRALLELVYADPSRVPGDRIEEAVDELTRRRDVQWADQALVRSLRGLVSAQLVRGPRSLWWQAARITAPTLVVWGEGDRLVEVGVGHRAAKVIPNSRLVVYHDASHVAQMEKPVEVATEVLRLFASEREWRARHGGQIDGTSRDTRGVAPHSAGAASSAGVAR